MAIALRDYQTQAIEKIKESFDAGITKQLVSLPTASGKTIIMAALAKRMGWRTLLLAHREELITQAADKFKLVWPKADYGICMAEQNEPGRPIVFGSVQSCSRDNRLSLLKENKFQLLLIDEAHHASSPSYQKLIQELGFADGVKNRLLVGVTATPLRSDSKQLGDTFEEITYSISVETLINAGYLSPVVGRRILTKASLKGVRSADGDFAVGELSEAVNTPERNAFIAESYSTYAKDRKGIAFCCDVQHCKDLAEAFRNAQIPAKAVYGDMCSIERKSTLEALKTGKIQVATSCGVLTEGFDEPTIGCVVMARPTKFKGLYIQCVGRGLRLHPAKSDCLVLDFTDEGHKLDSIATLSKAIPGAQVFGEKADREEGEQEAKTHSIYIRRVCNEEFDILGYARFIWIPIGEDEWSLADDIGNEIVMSPCGGGYIANIYWKEGASNKLVADPLPLDYCSGSCEDFARANLKLNLASAEGAWLDNSYPPTDAQSSYLLAQGIDPNRMTRAQASMQIRKLVALKRKRYRKQSNEPITSKQAYFLKMRGVNASNFTKFDAMKAIAKLKIAVGV